MKNSTIIPKKKKCRRCGKDCYWFSDKMCKECSNIESFQRRSAKVTQKVLDDDNLTDLINQFDDVFSKYIRLSGADPHTGLAECYTCGVQKHYSLLQNGHYMSRGSLYLRFSEDNCKIQCQHCNETLKGNLSAYRERLERDFPGRVEILEQDFTTAYKPTRNELREQIAYYTKKVKELKSKVNSIK